MENPTHDFDEARRVHDDAILVDGQGVTVLLPVAQVVPKAVVRSRVEGLIGIAAASADAISSEALPCRRCRTLTP